MAIHRPSYEHELSDPARCQDCGWTGTAQEAFGEIYRELTDFRCPDCDRLILIVPHVTVAEMREYAAAGNEKAIRELADFERRANED